MLIVNEKEYNAAKRKFPKYNTMDSWGDNLSLTEKYVLYENFQEWLKTTPTESQELFAKIKDGYNPMKEIKAWRVWLGLLLPFVGMGIFQWLFGTTVAIFLFLCLGLPFLLLVGFNFIVAVIGIVQLNKMNEFRKQLEQ